MSVLKEPLLHFALAGATLFGAYAWMNRTPEIPNASKATQIKISAGDIQWLDRELDDAMAASTDA